MVLEIGIQKIYFVLHTLSSIIAAFLIIWLAVGSALQKTRLHKQIAYAMAASGIISLVFSLAYGFSFSLTLRGIHHTFGFISLGLSLVPFLVKHSKNRLHCNLAYMAAAFAVLSIITGIIAYWSVIASLF
ncbi:hypothetical protein HY991_05270 [Candidatus Micrarchaeota archaeon]|nr:hypothetical protein [Candidatus Micrarchaeota archaeon]